MIDADMPKRRPPYLLCEKTRHGKTVWYVRRGEGSRARIHGEYGSAAFMAEYHAAIAASPEPKGNPRKPSSGTLAWLIARYRESRDWLDLSMATRRQRENILRQIIDTAGHEPFDEITGEDVEGGRDKREATPFQARHYLDTLRSLFRWALKKKLVAVDPTASIENLRRPSGGGFAAWAEEDVAAYCDRWPIGTKERVWIDVLLYTGLRRGDAVVLGRQHIRSGFATIKTQKTGMEVTLPILPELQRTLAVGPSSDLAFICGDRGLPLKKEAFGNMFREACRSAGVEKSAHGVRKIAATRLADSGATEAQLDAIFGWSGGQMAQLYTRTANRRRLATEAMGRMSEAKGAAEQREAAPNPAHQFDAPHPRKTNV